MDHAICTICNLDWGISRYTITSNYICPVCSWKIKKNIKIKLGGKKKDGRKLVCVLYSHF